MRHRIFPPIRSSFPLVMTLEEKGLETRIRQWVQDSGVWVVGPLSDIRNSYGARYTHEYFGFLEKLTGARWMYGIPDGRARCGPVE